MPNNTWQSGVRRCLAACGALAAVAMMGGPLEAQQAARHAPRDGAFPIVVGKVLRSVSRTAPIVIDGCLDDAGWRTAPVANDFVQQYPDVRAAASQRTEARVVVDDAALYVGMRLYDSAPDSIVAPLARRDYNAYTDWAQVLIDSYLDHRTAFRFMLNPAGVQRDVLLTGDDEWNEDDGWNAVWAGAATRDSLGWTAEFRIPLSQLRFSISASGTTRWGLQFGRQLARRNERDYWAPVLPDRAGFVSQFGTLDDVRLSAVPRRLELVPYSLAQVTHAPGDPGNPLFRQNLPRTALGADVKVGVTQDLTLTATANPDFGQVEADPSEVNLTGVESFFAERRPFFLEGSDLFAYPLSSVSWLSGQEQLVYSRRIGRTPQGDDPAATTWVDRPSATPLLGALKLSGKTAGGWRIGVLSAVTDAVYARTAGSDDGGDTGRGRALIEPMTHYGVARLGRDFLGGDATLGGVVTTVARKDGVPTLRSNAVVGGLDGRWRFGQHRYQLAGNLLISRVGGSPAAIVETQDGIGHLYQRVDATYLDVDSSRTSLVGAMSEVRLLKLGGGHLRWGLVGKAVTPGFEVNDLGIQPRADALVTAGWIGWEGFLPSRYARRWSVWSNQWGGWTFGGERQMLGYNIWSDITLHNNWHVEGSIDDRLPALSVSALRGGPALRTPRQLVSFIRVVTDPRRAVVATVEVRGAHNIGEAGGSVTLMPQFEARLGDRTQLVVAPSVSRWDNPQQYVAAPTLTGSPAPAWIVGDLHQTSAAVTLRASYAFTPRLTIQAYAEPFVSTGEYRSFGSVGSARALSIIDRIQRYSTADVHETPAGTLSVPAAGNAGLLDFDRPDYTIGELRSNAVMRWEYRPGSTLFVVWSQGRSYDGDPTRFDAAGQARRLFDTGGTNVFLVKVSHWIGH